MFVQGELRTFTDPADILAIPLAGTGAKRRMLSVPNTTSKRLTRVGSRGGHGIYSPERDTSWSGGTFELDAYPGVTWQPWSHGPRRDEFWCVGTDADGNRVRPILIDRFGDGKPIDTWAEVDSREANRCAGKAPLRARELAEIGFDRGARLVHRWANNDVTVLDFIRTRQGLVLVVVEDGKGVRETLPIRTARERYRIDGPPVVGMVVEYRPNGRRYSVTAVTDDTVVLDGQVAHDRNHFWMSYR